MSFLSWEGRVNAPGGPTEVSRGMHIDDAVILKGLGGKSRGDDLPCRSHRPSFSRPLMGRRYEVSVFAELLPDNKSLKYSIESHLGR